MKPKPMTDPDDGPLFRLALHGLEFAMLLSMLIMIYGIANLLWLIFGGTK